MNKQAVSEYLDKTHEAQDSIEAIKKYLDNLGNVAESDVNWAHVGDMNHLNNTLSEMKRFLQIRK